MKKTRKRKSFGRRILWQNTYEARAKTTHTGESSPYWDWLPTTANSDGGDRLVEPPLANPDVLPDTDDYQDRRVRLQETIAKVYGNLSGRESQVFNLLSMGLTEEKIAAKLKVSRSMIQQCRGRIRKKFESNDDIRA